MKQPSTRPHPPQRTQAPNKNTWAHRDYIIGIPVEAHDPSIEPIFVSIRNSARRLEIPVLMLDFLTSSRRFGLTRIGSGALPPKLELQKFESHGGL